MQDPNAAPGGLSARKVTVVSDAAEQGMPVIGDEDTTQLTDEGAERLVTTILGSCAGCLAALHEAAEIGATCVVCRGILCLTCGATRCADCGKAVCHDHSEMWGEAALCQPDYERKLNGCLIPMGIAAFIAGVLLLWGWLAG